MTMGTQSTAGGYILAIRAHYGAGEMIPKIIRKGLGIKEEMKSKSKFRWNREYSNN